MFKGLKKKTLKDKPANGKADGTSNGTAAEHSRTDGPKAGRVATNGHSGASEVYQKPPVRGVAAREPVVESDYKEAEPEAEPEPAAPALPDYMINQNAVLEDEVPWRHGSAPDYTAANTNFLRERTNVWPPGSLEDLVSNLVKNWEKEASYKTRLQDWRTINGGTYRFSCNGGREYTANEMMQIGTYNALIQEAAFYSAKHTSFDESHEVFRRAMPGGFAWEVTEVYSGPPVVAFKWRHWGRMTGKLVCPIGPDTKLEADPTNQEVEIFGVCVCHLGSDFKICKLEIFYDPHELMASLVDARNLCYKSPDSDSKIRKSVDLGKLTSGMDTLHTSDDGFAAGVDDFSERDGARSLKSDSLASDLPSDAALLASVTERPARALPGSRCPFPHA